MEIPVPIERTAGNQTGGWPLVANSLERLKCRQRIGERPIRCAS